MSNPEIFQCFQTKNRSYEVKKSPITPVGILVHSTGSTNKTLKRWVDAPERLGKNLYGNHWNKASANKSMHAFIGYDKAQKIIVAQTLPYDRACWGAGKGNNGSANYDPTAYLQFEICQGNNTDATYYRAVMEVAEAYCAYLCREFGWTAANITSHAEAHRDGLASNHGDPISWMKHFGDSMDAFRARVAARLSGETIETQVTESPGAAGSETPATETPGKAPGSAQDAPEALGGVTMPTIRNGAQGVAVKVMQRLLIAHGAKLSGYGADGKCGNETVQAVKAFQTAHNLTPDGVCGPLTWAALAG